MSANTAKPRPPRRIRQREFLDPESRAAMMFLSQLLLFRLTLNALHEIHHGCGD